MYLLMLRIFMVAHLVYGIVAVLFTVVIVIGLPLLLILEPFLKFKDQLCKNQTITGSVSRLLQG